MRPRTSHGPASLGQCRSRALVLAMGALVALAGGCTSTTSPTATAPTTTPPPATATPTPTTSLFGQPPPFDPCALVQLGEVQTVLQQIDVTSRSEETNGGDSTTCFFDTPAEDVFARVTIVKPPVSEAEFRELQQSFGQRARPIEDLGRPAFAFTFGPLASAYGLESGTEVYIDAARPPTPATAVLEPTVALLERALARMAALAPSPSPSAS